MRSESRGEPRRGGLRAIPWQPPAYPPHIKAKFRNGPKARHPGGGEKLGPGNDAPVQKKRRIGAVRTDSLSARRTTGYRGDCRAKAVKVQSRHRSCRFDKTLYGLETNG